MRTSAPRIACPLHKISPSLRTTVTRPIPDYLRLHVEDTCVPPAAPAEEPRGALDRLCESFRQATGWALRHGEGPAPLQSPDVLWARTLCREKNRESHLAINRSPGKTAHDLQNELLPLCDLVDSVADLISNQYQTQQALVQREAELALGVPLVSHHDEDGHLSDILQASLQSAAEAIGAKATGLYLLDDATSQLKLRAAWGLPADRFVQPARDLQGAIADLEALTGNAVVIEDTSLLPHWKTPEPFASAMCVPVSTSTTPLGTLWFFGEVVRDYNEQQTNLAEIIAGRIAVELERQILLGEVSQRRGASRNCDSLRHAHDAQLPVGPIATNEWEVAALSHQGRETPHEFYDWNMNADGSLSVVLAELRGSDDAAVMGLQLLRGATKSVLLQNNHPESAVRNTAEVVWSGTTGEHHPSLSVLRLLSDVDRFEYCSAGPVGALIVRPGRPTAISQGAPPLATDPDVVYRGAEHKIAPGETIVLVSDTLRKSLNSTGEQLGEAAIAACVRENLAFDAERLTHLIFDLWRDHTADPQEGVSIIVARRRS